jgi:hypothetical protein
MNILLLPSELQTLWANRRDPRAARALAEMLWRVFLALGAVLVAVSWCYSFYLAIKPNDIIAADTTPPQASITFDKKAMGDILDSFELRAEKATGLRSSPPVIADPGKATNKQSQKTVSGSKKSTDASSAQ